MMKLIINVMNNKSGSMLSNLKLQLINMHISNNYVLYYKTNIKIDDIDPK